jgi:hypothetical protein
MLKPYDEPSRHSYEITGASSKSNCTSRKGKLGVKEIVDPEAIPAIHSMISENVQLEKPYFIATVIIRKPLAPPVRQREAIKGTMNDLRPRAWSFSRNLLTANLIARASAVAATAARNRYG